MHSTHGVYGYPSYVPSASFAPSPCVMMSAGGNMSTHYTTYPAPTFVEYSHPYSTSATTVHHPAIGSSGSVTIRPSSNDFRLPFLVPSLPESVSYSQPSHHASAPIHHDMFASMVTPPEVSCDTHTPSIVTPSSSIKGSQHLSRSARCQPPPVPPPPPLAASTSTLPPLPTSECISEKGSALSRLPQPSTSSSPPSPKPSDEPSTSSRSSKKRRRHSSTTTSTSVIASTSTSRSQSKRNPRSRSSHHRSKTKRGARHKQKITKKSRRRKSGRKKNRSYFAEASTDSDSYDERLEKELDEQYQVSEEESESDPPESEDVDEEDEEEPRPVIRAPSSTTVRRSRHPVRKCRKDAGAIAAVVSSQDDSDDLTSSTHTEVSSSDDADFEMKEPVAEIVHKAFHSRDLTSDVEIDDAADYDSSDSDLIILNPKPCFSPPNTTPKKRKREESAPVIPRFRSGREHGDTDDSLESPPRKKRRLEELKSSDMIPTEDFDMAMEIEFSGASFPFDDSMIDSDGRYTHETHDMLFEPDRPLEYVLHIDDFRHGKSDLNDREAEICIKHPRRYLTETILSLKKQFCTRSVGKNLLERLSISSSMVSESFYDAIRRDLTAIDGLTYHESDQWVNETFCRDLGYNEIQCRAKKCSSRLGYRMLRCIHCFGFAHLDVSCSEGYVWTDEQIYAWQCMDCHKRKLFYYPDGSCNSANERYFHGFRLLSSPEGVPPKHQFYEKEFIRCDDSNTMQFYALIEEEGIEAAKAFYPKSRGFEMEDDVRDTAEALLGMRRTSDTSTTPTTTPAMTVASGSTVAAPSRSMPSSDSFVCSSVASQPYPPHRFERPIRAEEVLQRYSPLSSKPTSCIYTPDLLEDLLKGTGIETKYFCPKKKRSHCKCFCDYCCEKNQEKPTWWRPSSYMEELKRQNQDFVVPDDGQWANDYGANYVIPRGCYRFGLSVDEHRCTVDRVFTDWVIAYHGTNLENVNSILRHASLLMPGDTTADGTTLGIRPGHYVKAFPRFNDHTEKIEFFETNRIFVSPSPKYSALYAPAYVMYCPSVGKHVMFRVLFQLRVQPQTYHCGQNTTKKEGVDEHVPDKVIEFYTNRRGVIRLTGLMFKVESIFDL